MVIDAVLASRYAAYRKMDPLNSTADLWKNFIMLESGQNCAFFPPLLFVSHAVFSSECRFIIPLYFQKTE
jgi:hypothetical protein